VQVSLHPALHAWPCHGWPSKFCEGAGSFPELVGSFEEPLVRIGIPTVRYAHSPVREQLAFGVSKLVANRRGYLACHPVMSANGARTKCGVPADPICAALRKAAAAKGTVGYMGADTQPPWVAEVHRIIADIGVEVHAAGVADGVWLEEAAEGGV